MKCERWEDAGCEMHDGKGEGFPADSEATAEERRDLKLEYFRFEIRWVRCRLGVCGVVRAVIGLGVAWCRSAGVGENPWKIRRSTAKSAC